ncbi:MAG: mismatch repair protein MutS-like protein [Clostridiaceae bacterium]|jgi:DNA mismatch repair ATPase MutS|nr:mismatch repair protein MutS-like protein [Clostridiaceae bacterium]
MNFFSVTSKNKLNTIYDNWGKQVKRKRNFKAIKEYFKTSNTSSSFLDDLTWSDLNMDKVFTEVDRTLSTPGEHVLYSLLRTPFTNEDTLNDRKNKINFFSENKEIRGKMQILLSGIGKTTSDVTSVLYEKLEESPFFKTLCSVLALSFIASLIYVLLFRNYSGLMFALFTGCANMYIHYKLDSTLKSKVATVKYLGYVVNAATRLSNINNPELNNYIDKLKSLSKSCGKIGKRAANVGRIEGLDVLGDYINIMLLLQERNYFSLVNEIETHKSELLELYNLIGELDCFISIASYRVGLSKFVEPAFTHNGKFLKAENIVHPLIQNPVANSICIENEGIIITGSNMSGKSTFLRTLAINAVLAQTIVTCLADSYTSSFFNIVTSINPEDNVLEGKSYYFSEAEAILRIIKSSEEEIPCLAIIDEIFSGTNPVERISASAEILDYLVNHNSLPIIATHDLQLTHMVNNYQCYYFRENVDENGLTFDYSIKRGISPTRNAIRLLKYLGYPEEIVSKTEDRIAQL